MRGRIIHWRVVAGVDCRGVRRKPSSRACCVCRCPASARSKLGRTCDHTVGGGGARSSSSSLETHVSILVQHNERRWHGAPGGSRLGGRHIYLIRNLFKAGAQQDANGIMPCGYTSSPSVVRVLSIAPVVEQSCALYVIVSLRFHRFNWTRLSCTE
ncbi:hypothetical protein BC628DRAFT_1403945 [Trametes gibbosa]|nr:hypothetical protein BC628DRAFT_1403945 [Trametes gibbosa]